MAEQVEIEVPEPAEDGPTLYTLGLRDKPDGYGLGEYRGHMAVVTRCPKCNQGGFRAFSRLVVHAVVLKLQHGVVTLDRETVDACRVAARVKPVDPQTALEL